MIKNKKFYIHNNKTHISPFVNLNDPIYFIAQLIASTGNNISGTIYHADLVVMNGMRYIFQKPIVPRLSISVATYLLTLGRPDILKEQSQYIKDLFVSQDSEMKKLSETLMLQLYSYNDLSKVFTFLDNTTSVNDEITHLIDFYPNLREYL